MAKCDAGYFCRVCGEYVEDITTSEIYLRYVIGEVPLEELIGLPEAHVWCNADLAQYITDPAFVTEHPLSPVEPKNAEDPAVVAQREDLVTRGWRRLQEIPELGIGINEYPIVDNAQFPRMLFKKRSTGA